jgi:molecular chaperone GrpE (heat shock protein)
MSKVKNLKKLNNLKSINTNQTNSRATANPKIDKQPIKVPIVEIKPNADKVKPEVRFDTTSQEVQPAPKLEPESAVSKNAELALLKIQLESKEIEAQDWQSKAFRYVADLENYKKQQELEISQIKKNTKKYAVKPLLEYLNNQYLALNFIKDITDEKTTKALSMFRTSFDKLIVEYKLQGVELILPVEGDEFDPVVMQALAPTDDEHAKVKHIVSIGLKIDNQLIQPVMVVL